MSVSLVLRIDNRDFAGRISTYNVTKEVTYSKVITTLSGEEVVRNKRTRSILRFSLIPYADSTASRDYEILKKGLYDVVYTDPDTNEIVVKNMRLVSNLEKAYLLDSVNGKRYYRGGEIQLRSTTVEEE